MKTRHWSIRTFPVLIAFAVSAFCSPGLAQPFASGEAPEFVEGEVLLKYRSDVTDAQIAASFRSAGLGLLRQFPARGSGEVGITHARTTMPVAQALAVLGAHPGVEHAQPNWVYTRAEAFNSSDPFYTQGSLWGLYGPVTQPACLFGSSASSAWIAGLVGSSEVCVGIIDEGIDYSHADLVANIWSNPSETPANGIDDDGNGYVDDVHGCNTIEGNGDIFDEGTDSSGNPYDAHGTHVAGTIGAQANDIGVVGVCWNIRIISAKFLNRDGSGTTADAVEAFNYLTDLKRRGFNIVAINNSWRGGAYDALLFNSISAAAREGILCVAAAGNDYMNTDRRPVYPAGYDTTSSAGYDSVIAVTAIDKYGDKAGFANYGVRSVDLGAPGVNITSTYPGGRYAMFNGTSMAAPHVTSALALYAAAFPATSAAGIKAALLASAEPTSALSAITATKGRLDIRRLLQQASSGPAPSTPTALTVTTQMSQAVVKWTDSAIDETGFIVERAEGAAGFGSYAVVGPNVTTFTDGNINARVKYSYRVKALGQKLDSQYSNIATLTLRK